MQLHTNIYKLKILREFKSPQLMIAKVRINCCNHFRNNANQQSHKIHLCQQYELTDATAFHQQADNNCLSLLVFFTLNIAVYKHYDLCLSYLYLLTMCTIEFSVKCQQKVHKVVEFVVFIHLQQNSHVIFINQNNIYFT